MDFADAAYLQQQTDLLENQLQDLLMKLTLANRRDLESLREQTRLINDKNQDADQGNLDLSTELVLENFSARCSERVEEILRNARAANRKALSLIIEKPDEAFRTLLHARQSSLELPVSDALCKALTADRDALRDKKMCQLFASREKYYEELLEWI